MVCFRQEEKKAAERAGRDLTGARPVHRSVPFPGIGMTHANARERDGVHKAQDADAFQLRLQSGALALAAVICSTDTSRSVFVHPATKRFDNLPIREISPVDLRPKTLDPGFPIETRAPIVCTRDSQIA